ncbi:low molecular weight protein arginine phosphatase [Lentibacillus saliphilus]|uniref:low molecular weight protein arginine phosphatase n=1 Tax=Lentibacillus saliphilus TaxID=2737028 RepID=UPI001C2F4367|nr:low molecular weight protein arginine phosphatase [Lentibacillus saliphilus]
MNILFICTGNTCRSPMAEALLKDKYPEASVQSAGIFAGENERASPFALQALANRNMELNHRTQPVDASLLNWADVVLTMTTSHKQTLIVEYPEYQDIFYTLKEYVSTSDEEVWAELRKRYADLEEKRAIFVRDHKHELDYTKLNQALQARFKDDLERIKQLETTLMSYDISDPFGGSQAVYEKTLDELDMCITALVEKLKHHNLDI